MINLILCNWLGWWNYIDEALVQEQMDQNSSYFFNLLFTMVSIGFLSRVKQNLIDVLLFLNLPFTPLHAAGLEHSHLRLRQKGRPVFARDCKIPFAQKLRQFLCRRNELLLFLKFVWFWIVKSAPCRIGAHILILLIDIQTEKHSKFKTQKIKQP